MKNKDKQTGISVSEEYQIFLQNFSQFSKKNKEIVENTLANIFTMRLIGNKTHGDLAEVGITEFINQFMPNYSCEHVGKDLYRAKEHEEDILITNQQTKAKIPVSLKAYGDGPLQLSTDKDKTLFPLLEKYGDCVNDQATINEILSSQHFEDIFSLNVMPLIYREDDLECNIMIFNIEKAKQEIKKIIKVTGKEEGEKGKGRKYPIYKFVNDKNGYIFEVRYGGPNANALQRGLWTNTKRAESYFQSVTNGWIKYEHNLDIIKLIRLALNSSKDSHQKVNELLLKDIQGTNKNV